MSTAAPGASAEAIGYHYSIGNEFYRLWLDNTITYSGALWEDGDSLEAAQYRKLDYHLTQAKVQPGSRVLDVGCGWGSGLRRMVEKFEVGQAVGLTLSQAQADWIASQHLPRTEVRVETWLEHAPAEPYDAIISIGAFEHFAKPELTSDQKVEAYRAYFKRCHELLNPGSWMTLQTIAYGNVSKEELSQFVEKDIFPESDLPTLTDIARACDGYFEVVGLRNDRKDYERTNRAWLSNLRARRAEAVKLVGEQDVVRYERYLALFIIGFHTGTMNLFRFTFRRNDKPRLDGGISR
jgi:cyclopropane-fatty-acyl-phospholipid synthase